MASVSETVSGIAGATGNAIGGAAEATGNAVIGAGEAAGNAVKGVAPPAPRARPSEAVPPTTGGNTTNNISVTATPEKNLSTSIGARSDDAQAFGSTPMEGQAVTIGLVVIIFAVVVAVVGIYRWFANGLTDVEKRAEAKVEDAKVIADAELEKVRKEMGERITALALANNKLEMEMVRYGATFQHVESAVTRVEAAVSKLTERLEDLSKVFQTALVSLANKRT